MDWNNVDLNSSDVEAQMLDAYSFDTLLLEVSCNVRDINHATVRAQFMESLNSKIQSAKDVFNANIDNIVAKAIADREDK